MPDQVLAGRRGGAWVKWVLRLAVGLLLLAVLLAKKDNLHLTLQVFWRVPWWVVLLALVGFSGSQVICAVRWWLLLRARQCRISLLECIRWYFAGMFWNLFMPTSLGGDSVRAVMAAPHSGGLAASISTIFVERMVGFLNLILIAVSGVAVSEASRGASGTRAVAGVCSLGVIIAGFLLTNYLLMGLHRRYPATAFLVAAHRLLQTLWYYLERKRLPALLWALLLSVLAQIVQMSVGILLAESVQLHVALTTWWWVLPSLGISTMIPVSLGGLGVREYAAVRMLPNPGYSEGTIIGWSLLWQLTVWLCSLPGGLLMMRGWLAKSSSPVIDDRTDRTDQTDLIKL